MTDNGQVATEKVQKAATYSEIGASGLLVYAGRVHDEFNRNLRGDNAVKAFREMQDNDPTVGALLFAIENIVREVSWAVEPRDPADADDVFWAERVGEAIHDMSQTWPSTISSIISMLPYGWSFLETVYKIRGGDVEDSVRRSEYDDGLIGWRKWAIRAQESLWKWDLDDAGGLRSFIQRTPQGQMLTIPIQRGLLFRTTVARGNPEGRSLLRNAYRPWYFKKRIEEIEAIGIERDLAGLPVALIPPEYLADDASAEQKAILGIVKETVRDIKRDEQEGVVWPLEYDESGNPLWKLELLSTGGARQFNTDAIVARYDQRISMTVLADFILLGHEMVGSKALGVSKIELFTLALTYILDEISAVVNAYAIPRLLRINGVEAVHSPRLTHGEVKQVDLKGLGDFVQSIAAAGIPFTDPAAMAYLRAAAELPPVDADPSEL